MVTFPETRNCGHQPLPRLLTGNCLLGDGQVRLWVKSLLSAKFAVWTLAWLILVAFHSTTRPTACGGYYRGLRTS